MTNPVEMPRYVSINYVTAIKIKSQEPTELSYSAPWKLTPEEVGMQTIIVPYTFMAAYRPENGGYYVKSADGQASYMSAQSFEMAYSKG